MADQDSKNGPSIPEWQQKYHQASKEKSTSSEAQPSPSDNPTPPSSSSELPLLEQARKFLDDESIRDAPMEHKLAFLQKKGVRPDDIEQLLGSERTSSASLSTSNDSLELKNIHDSSEKPSEREQEMKATSTSSSELPQAATVAPKREIPPIITYPEFLLKPQKPPPLVTVERLAHAASAFAGISALTYAARQYIVQPMLESLTEARHELAEGTKADLETLNTKLESTVSRIPYIASSIILQRKKDQGDELESVDSDPTELFHRDIATQTSPQHSRSMSLSSQDLPAPDPTTSQSSRLRSLHGTLSSLLTSTTTHFSQDQLKEQMSEFQGVLTKLEASYDPFQVDYGSTFSSYSNGALSGDDKNKTKKAPDSEMTKFKNEIRSLKGAFLSSRNFPAARPTAPFALPTR
ncbi:uncharacterized protein Z518_07588 [Rhinocladiella mackenziei CBS 650.93]|uniref:Peroxisomal membrane protein PEX14 n=1 Tax=Rhinocladiella mackenziei CBS 650.93 TaxID=1442369 RepID=A0A0D2J4X6_9EURO|nr:uncharacterized protein Z518_07588 [Rhinocladiella mackenziei CBS 650.93]KIX04035.1 hypothetical protein Z518_07588 [Rhinocladiella mackenziei CBS 650.93]